MSRYFAVVCAFILAACQQSSDSLADTDPLKWAETHPFVSEATWRGVEVLRCTAEVLDVCDPKKCVSQSPNSFLRWHPATGEYERCDDQGCDSYQGEITYSGAFANITLPDNAALLRLTGANEYTEVAAFMDKTFVYRGTCNPS